MKIRTFDVTGMGDEYEQAVQKMIWTGVQFLQKNNVTEFISKECPNIIGFVDNQGDIGKQFDDILEIAIPGHTGAMNQWATRHAKYINIHGYKNWASELDSKKQNESFEFEFDGDVDLDREPLVDTQI